jgi:hypothetical protein
MVAPLFVAILPYGDHTGIQRKQTLQVSSIHLSILSQSLDLAANAQRGTKPNRCPMPRISIKIHQTRH